MKIESKLLMQDVAPVGLKRVPTKKTRPTPLVLNAVAGWTVPRKGTVDRPGPAGSGKGLANRTVAGVTTVSLTSLSRSPYMLKGPAKSGTRSSSPDSAYTCGSVWPDWGSANFRSATEFAMGCVGPTSKKTSDDDIVNFQMRPWMSGM